jgi:ribosome-associated protein
VVRITPAVDIPESDLAFRYSRSSGPGGQNVNKVATKVTLLFDIEESDSLSSDQKAHISERLANRISRDGVLRVTSQRHRTRSANQREAVRRFAALIADALHEHPERRRTRVPTAEKRRRLEGKRRRSRTKKLRAKPIDD